MLEPKRRGRHCRQWRDPIDDAIAAVEDRWARERLERLVQKMVAAKLGIEPPRA